MRTLFSILLITIISTLQAQVITVKDSETMLPLEFVTISVPGTQRWVSTDSLGEASLAPFTKADHLDFRLVGYVTQRFSYRQLEAAHFEVFLSPQTYSLHQVVVTATRWSQASREVPLKVASMPRSKAALHNPQTAADLLGHSGQVFIQKSQQGGGSPMIRGFATNRLLMAVDGVRMNNAIFRSGNIQNVISLDPFAIELTEVIFGPGSVIYGSDAIGGVMSFSTLRPRHATSGQAVIAGGATTRYASASNERTAHFNINYGLRKWAFLTSMTHTRYGNLRMGSFGPEEYLRHEYVYRQQGQDLIRINPDPQVQVPVDYSQTNFMQKISFRPNTRWELNYGIHYSATSDYDRYDRLIAYRNGQPRSAEWYYGPQVWSMNNLKLTHYPSQGRLYDQMAVLAAHQYFRESRHNRNFNDIILRNRTEQVNAWSLNLDLKKAVAPGHMIFYGVEGIVNDVHSSGEDQNVSTGEKKPGAPRYPQALWASYAGYMTWQWKASQKINFQAGGRYNGFSLDAAFDNSFYSLPFSKASLQNGALTASLGMAYHPSSQWQVNANLSTGFRAPNVDDVGKIFDSEPGMVIVPNPELKAEYARNAELGVTRRFGDVLRVNLIPFITLLDHAMVRRPATLEGRDSLVYDGYPSRIYAVQNAAFARVWGLQTSLEAQIIHPSLVLSSEYNFQKGVEELDDGSISPLRHAGPWFGITRLTYTRKKITLQGSVNYSGGLSFEELAPDERGKTHLYAIDSHGNPYSAPWYTLNLRTKFQVSQHLMLSANIENITDQRYRPYSSGLVAPGVNFIIGLNVNFSES